MSIPTVAVVGGGITGLAAAWELCLSGDVRVVVFEAEGHLGGKVMTAQIGGRPVDVGPDAFVARREEAVGLCFELGLAPELVAPSANRAYVWSRGRLRPLPDGLVLGVPTRIGPLVSSGICSLRGLRSPSLDLVAPPIISRRHGGSAVDDSIGAIVHSRLGDEVHDLLADPLIGGIHAGPIDTMSAAAVFPQLLNASRSRGSLMRALRQRPSGSGPVFLGFRRGMARLTERFTEALREHGVEIHTGAAVEKIERGNMSSSGSWKLLGSYEGGVTEADALVLALDAHGASRLLGPHDGALAELLGSIPYSSVTLVTLRLPAGSVSGALDGSGFLVPVVEGRLLTACTWLSSKWPHGESGEVLLRASMGRYGDERTASMDDDEVVAACIGELSQMIGLRADPLDAITTRWPDAFPQYLVGHRTRVREIESRAARLGALAVAGAAMEGVGIPACIGSGRKAARTLLGRFAPVKS